MNSVTDQTNKTSGTTTLTVAANIIICFWTTHTSAALLTSRPDLVVVDGIMITASALKTNKQTKQNKQIE